MEGRGDALTLQVHFDPRFLGLILYLLLTVSNPAEEFNDRILCPELSDSQKKMLHEELRKIYETYCLDESVDKIRFDPFIVEEIRNSMWL